MVVELKLRKIGNSAGVILPKEALAHLNVQEGDSVTMTEGPAASLRLSPYKAEASRQMAVVQDVMKRNRNALRELATGEMTDAAYAEWLIENSKRV